MNDFEQRALRTNRTYGQAQILRSQTTVCKENKKLHMMRPLTTLTTIEKYLENGCFLELGNGFNQFQSEN